MPTSVPPPYGRFVVSSVAVVGVLLSLLAWRTVTLQLDANYALEFDWVAHNRARALEHGVGQALGAMRTLGDLEVLESLDPSGFEDIARALMSRTPGVSAMGRVPAGGDQARPTATWVLGAVAHDEVAPPLDLDLDARAVLQDARARCSMVVGAWRQPTSVADADSTVLVALPGQHGASGCEGLVVGLLSLSELARSSIGLLEPRGVDCLIQDASAPGGERTLAFYASRLSPGDAPGEIAHGGMRFEDHFEVANRTWAVTCASTPTFRSAEAFSEGPWVVLAAGLLFTALLSAYLLRLKAHWDARLSMAEAQRQREQLFWSMTEIADQVFWAVGQDRRFQYVSSAFEKTWGQSCTEVYRDPSVFFDAVPNEDRRALEAGLERVFAAGEALALTHRVLLPDGTSRWVHHSAFPVHDEQGRTTLAVGYVADITNRKLAEETLRDSERELRTLFNHSPDLILTVARDGAIILTNRRTADLSAAEGDSTRMLPRELHQAYREALDRLFDTGEIDRLRFEAKDGSSWELRFVPIRGEQGEVVAAMIIATDITEKLLLDQAAMRNARLASLGAIAAGVAHEINNPNNAIAFNAGVLSRVWRDAQRVLDAYLEDQGDFALGGLSFAEDGAEISETITQLTANSERIQHIVSGLKRLGRDDPGEMGPVDINAVVRAALKLLGEQIRRHTDHLEVALGDDLPPVRGNAQQLEQVLINAVQNALHALPERARGVRVSTRHQPQQRRVLLTVEDDGVGVPGDLLDRITEPFFTTRADRGGTGLGLSITQTIVDRHDGTLTLGSIPGGGTRLTVSLPADRSDQAEDRVEERG